MELTIIGNIFGLPYFIQILDSKEFLSGTYTTKILDKIETGKQSIIEDHKEVALLAAGVRALEYNGNNENSQEIRSGHGNKWKLFGRMKNLRRF